MNLLTNIASFFGFNTNRYSSHKEAVIVTCFYNFTGSPYRLSAFKKFYDTIKHLNHRIIEIETPGAANQLSALGLKIPNLVKIQAKSQLWHKETVLNQLIKTLPKRYKYVFWIDADVLFTNKNWLTDSVKQFEKGKMILQPFSYCVHLDRDETEPSFDLDEEIEKMDSDKRHKVPYRHPKMWRSFGYNYATDKQKACSHNYDIHGHVGFAWGARREIFDNVELYDKALVGGADHIIAHAAVGECSHPCIEKTFTEMMDEIREWSARFYKQTRGKLGYAPGTLYHIWHGDVEKRDYYQRIKKYSPMGNKVTDRDENGLHTVEDDSDVANFVTAYIVTRELNADGHHHVDPTPGQPNVEFGGGSFGGAGAGGSWNETNNSDSNSDNYNPNFS
jgi:hypothetical protein